LQEFVKNEKGELKGLLIGDISYKHVDGKLEQEILNIREIPCELALIAAGFLHTDHSGLIDELKDQGGSLDDRGNISASPSYKTLVDKVFTAGDARRGQSLVVWAISEGREAARQVDLELMGKTALPGKSVSVFDL
jgi:glutamate synthase (NADPH/NADH) small chain